MGKDLYYLESSRTYTPVNCFGIGVFGVMWRWEGGVTCVSCYLYDGLCDCAYVLYYRLGPFIASFCPM